MAEPLLEVEPEVIPCDHLVQVYRSSFELAESAATFLASGFAAGEPAVAVAASAHWPLIAERLERRGRRASELEAEGRLVVVDAAETLAAICDADVPSTHRFASVIGGLIDRVAAGAAGQRVRVFGEMVDLLVRRGDPEAAEALEHMWNRLGMRRDFTLLCGYKIDVFDRDAQVALLPQVYRAHSHVLPTADSEQLEQAVDRALREVLGESEADKLYAQVERQVRDDRIPRAQRALMWASANMPRAAESILAASRKNYGLVASSET